MNKNKYTVLEKLQYMQNTESGKDREKLHVRTETKIGHLQLTYYCTKRLKQCHVYALFRLIVAVKTCNS